MKPCRKYKKLIALSIVDDEVDRHVSECAACAAYAKEVKRIYGEHRERAETLPEIEAPARLHGRVRDNITRHEAVDCCGIEVRASLRRLLQGFAVGATIIIILALVLKPAPRELKPAPAPVAVTKAKVIGEPTFAAYHNRLSRSVEEFEASLKEYGALNGGEVLKVSSASENLP